jgi:adenine-specific DNA methylase
MPKRSPAQKALAWTEGATRAWSNPAAASFACASGPNTPRTGVRKLEIHNRVWEVLHHLIRALKQEGETAAGNLLATVKEMSEAARQLAYRLHTLCERQGWAEDARAYNELITSWTGIETVAGAVPTEKTQGKLFE